MQNNHQSNSQSSTGTASIVASRRKFSLSRNSKWWLSGGLLFLLAVAGYITYAVFTNLELDAASCTTKTLSSGNNTTCVKYAQQLLNGVSAYYSAMPRGAASIPSTLISANGKYGASTTDRLKTFQTYGGLESTGILNKNTWFALCSYVKSAYTSYSSNLRSDTINTAASAFSKVSCSTATQEAEDVQGTATASVSNVDTDDPETTGQTTTQDVAIVGDSERDISAKQMVNSPTSATSIPLTVTTWNIAGGSKGFNAAQRLAGLQTIDDTADIISLQESHKADLRKLLRDTYLCDKCSNGSHSTMQGIALQNTPQDTNIYSADSVAPASAPILWKRDRFILEGYGAYTALAKTYRDENGDNVTGKWITWVRLHDNTTNKSFFVLNLHTPAGVEKSGTGMPIAKMKKRNTTYKYEMQLITKIVQNNFSSGNLPIVLTGDFNVDYRADKTVKYKYFPYVTMANLGFTSNWAFAESNGGLPASGSGSSTRLIDYVFIKRGTGISFDKTSINANMYGSDHHPVSAIIDIANN